MINYKIVFFDDVCSFCNILVGIIWKHNSENNIYYTPLQSNYAKQFLMNQGIKDIDFNTIYFYDGNSLSTKSRAVFNILNYLDGLFPIFYNSLFVDQLYSNCWNKYSSGRLLV